MDLLPLFRAADRMEEMAGILRARAAIIGAGAAATRWNSPAARNYHEYIDEVTAQLAGCALRLTTLADQVRTHALIVRAATP